MRLRLICALAVLAGTGYAAPINVNFAGITGQNWISLVPLTIGTSKPGVTVTVSQSNYPLHIPHSGECVGSQGIGYLAPGPGCSGYATWFDEKLNQDVSGVDLPNLPRAVFWTQWSLLDDGKVVKSGVLESGTLEAGGVGFDEVYLNWGFPTPYSFAAESFAGATPEPGTLLLLGSSLVGLAWWRRATRQ